MLKKWSFKIGEEGSSKCGLSRMANKIP